MKFHHDTPQHFLGREMGAYWSRALTVREKLLRSIDLLLGIQLWIFPPFLETRITALLGQVKERERNKGVKKGEYLC